MPINSIVILWGLLAVAAHHRHRPVLPQAKIPHPALAAPRSEPVIDDLLQLGALAVAYWSSFAGSTGCTGGQPARTSLSDASAAILTRP